MAAVSNRETGSYLPVVVLLESVLPDPPVAAPALEPVSVPEGPAPVLPAAGGRLLLSPMVPVLPGWSVVFTSPCAPVVVLECFRVFLWVVTLESPEVPVELSVWVLVLELS